MHTLRDYKMKVCILCVRAVTLTAFCSSASNSLNEIELSPLFMTTTTTLPVGVTKATHSSDEFSTELNILVEPRGVNLLY